MHVIDDADAREPQQHRPGQQLGVVEMRDAGAGTADGAIHPPRADGHAPQTAALRRAGVVDGKAVARVGLVALAVLHEQRDRAGPDPSQCGHLLDPDAGIGARMDGGEVDDGFQRKSRLRCKSR